MNSLGKFPVIISLIAAVSLLAQFPVPSGSSGGGGGGGDTFGCVPSLAAGKATVATACSGWYGANYITLGGTAEFTPSSGTGVVYAYFKNTALFFGVYSGTGTCANSTCEVLVSNAFPDGATQIAQWTLTSGSLGAAVDRRTIHRSTPLAAGTNIGLSINGNGQWVINNTASGSTQHYEDRSIVAMLPVECTGENNATFASQTSFDAAANSFGMTPSNQLAAGYPCSWYYGTSTAANNFAFIRRGNRYFNRMLYQIGNKTWQSMYGLQFDAVTSVRSWQGWSTGTGGTADADWFAADAPTSGDFIGFRFSTNASDTTLQLATCVGVTCTLNSVGGTLSANTFYWVQLYSNVAGTICAKVNGGTEVCNSTNVSTATAWNPYFWTQTLTTAARLTHIAGWRWWTSVTRY